MKRFVGLSFFFAGLIFLIFMVNLLLYSFSPNYRAALLTVVTGDDVKEIPVVDVNREVYGADTGNILRDKEAVEAVNIRAIHEELLDEDTPLAAVYDEADDEPAPCIIDKEYHEDCGTGEGYWIIKYEDGSVAVE